MQDKLKWYDYGARFEACPEHSLGNPVIGRWGSTDPLAEAYADYSPYNYVGNDPVLFQDPTGMYRVDGAGTITIDDPTEIANFIDYVKNNNGTSASDMANYIQNADNGFVWQLDPVTITSWTNTTWIANAQNQVANAVNIMNNAKRGVDWGDLGRDFANGFMNAEKSDMQSASAFVGYAGLPIAKNEALLRYTAKTATNWANKAFALRAVKGFAIVGKSAGVLGAGLTAIEDISKGNVGWGTAAKVGIGLVTTFGGPIGLAYGVIDIGYGMYTGTTLTDRLGAGVDSTMK